ncbi:PREDICTED: uncharacterized protein C1orf158 homolog [Polistes dominula]|uniref:Uncharacterized protein C1orf158 homolog n=1 Tax=Polistes dominula TaxID=743375 RepID=A0ABM1I314_POLDO|nr:PREDICTED: uncharacterized protein C1orf158 homolog [Polistes dominula]
MPVFSGHLKHSINLSLIDLHTKLNNKQEDKLDSIPAVSKRYDSKVLIGNWLERRTPYIPFSNDWITIYKQHYKPYDTNIYKKDRIEFWNNKIENEGLSSTLMDCHEKSYCNNMTTTYDLSYRILPKQLQKSYRIYNLRKNKWLPEQDLTKDFGNLTKTGIKDALQVWWDSISDDAIKFCRWRTTYQDEYKFQDVSLINKKFHKQRLNTNISYLSSLNHINEYSNGCPVAFSN